MCMHIKYVFHINLTKHTVTLVCVYWCIHSFHTCILHLSDWLKAVYLIFVCENSKERSISLTKVNVRKLCQSPICPGTFTLQELQRIKKKSFNWWINVETKVWIKKNVLFSYLSPFQAKSDLFLEPLMSFRNIYRREMIEFLSLFDVYPYKVIILLHSHCNKFCKKKKTFSKFKINLANMATNILDCMLFVDEPLIPSRIKVIMYIS